LVAEHIAMAGLLAELTCPAVLQKKTAGTM